ncbi:hypothetical protein [uncultured Sphingomonas sp.]|uniref:hypothetical protein n=1 Tax=uncultured Sphingomonas sp. TaxID=158754 RepID=UPI002639F852|nr:hypothetical protein [uncultured Sphingomonas sp.]
MTGLRLAPIIRDFLAIGSNIHITPEGRLDCSQGMPREWATNGPGAARIDLVTRSYLTASDRPGEGPRIERMVRRLGRRMPSGFIVLERAIAA